MEVLTLFQYSEIWNEQENPEPLMYIQVWHRTKQASFNRYISITEQTSLRKKLHFLPFLLSLAIVNDSLLLCHLWVMKTG